MGGGSASAIFSLLEKGIVPRLMCLVARIASEGERMGMRVFLVGGTVRDLLMRRDLVDVDIVVEGDAISLGRSVSELTGRRIVEYGKFGTCTLLAPEKGGGSRAPGEIRIDMATAREETYSSPGAYPDVRPAGIREDLKRRDFTINAMAFGLGREEHGPFIDLYGGVDDIDRGIIRVLHDKSFVDDPIRILRAVRFEQRFSFQIEPLTEKLIREAASAGALSTTRPSRVREEVTFMVAENLRKECFIRLRDLLGDDMAVIWKIIGEEEF